MRSLPRFFTPLAVVALLCSGTALAGIIDPTNTITGNLWHVPEATTLNAIPANVPGTTPCHEQPTPAEPGLRS